MIRSLHMLMFPLVLGALLWPTSAAAEVKYKVQWKQAASGVWPPAVIGRAVVLKSGNTVTAHDSAKGDKLWQVTLPSLRYGAGVLAAGKRYVYVLGDKGVYALDPRTGKQVKHRPLPAPASILVHRGSVYVSAAAGTYQLDPGLEQQLGLAKGITGELRGADGHRVVLYTHEPKAQGSPKRLKVVDLKQGKLVYQFKLLPRGSHQVVKVWDGKVVFIDYSKRTTAGKNATRLYYTETDFIKGAKLRDIALSDHYNTAGSDTFWVAGDPAGQVFLANHGEPGEPATLMAYDPARGKALWSRSGPVTSMGLLLHQGKLWTGRTAKGGKASVLVYSPDDGNPLLTLPLDAPGNGSPVGVGDRVLVRTRKSIYCFAPDAGKDIPDAPRALLGTAGVASPSAVKAAQLPTRALPGWRLMRHKPTGFVIQVPRSWKLEKKKMLKMGPMRQVIPFARVKQAGGRRLYLGSIKVLTWEAAGRNVDGLWQSVYAQRRQLSPDVRVGKVHRVRDVGGSGVPGIKATYTYRGPSGYAVQQRSLCVVHHGVAFELRAWVGPTDRRSMWKEVEQILTHFRPHKFK